MKYVLILPNYGKPLGTIGILEEEVGNRVWFRTSADHRMLVDRKALKEVQE